jgi:hypothetical protein
MGAAVLVVVVTGLARGQQPRAGGPALVGPGERTVTVEEPGKRGQVCKILKSWKKRDGTWVHQVQSLNTGEMMTIEESAPAAGGPASQMRSTARRVFHWGRSRTPPPGAPLPPPDTTVKVPPPAARPPAAAPAQPAGPVTTAARPSGICPAGVQITWPSAYATGPSGPGRAPIPLPSAGSGTVNPNATPYVSTAPLAPRSGPQEVYVQGTDGRLRPAAGVPHDATPVAGPTVIGHGEVMPPASAPPRRRFLSRLFGRDKKGDDAEAVFSAAPGAAVNKSHSTVVQAPGAVPSPLGRTVPLSALTPRAPDPTTLRSTPMAPPRPSAANAQPDNARRANAVKAPAAPARAAAVTTPTGAPAVAPRTAPTPAPAVKMAPPPVIVSGGTAKPVGPEPIIRNQSGTPGEPVIVNAPSAAPRAAPTLAPAVKMAPPPVIVGGGTAKPVGPGPIIRNQSAGAPGEPVIVSGPRRPLPSILPKPSDNKVTTVVAAPPLILAPEPKGKAVEPAKTPLIVTGPVTARPTASAGTPRNDIAPIGAPRPAAISQVSKPAPPAVKTVTTITPKPAPPVVQPVKGGDWRESWGKAGPAKSSVAVKTEAVAPRPTPWAPPAKPTVAPRVERAEAVAPRPPAWVPPAKPAAAPRAERVVFPKPADRKPDPLSDPASYVRLARQDTIKQSSDTSVATPRSPAPVFVGPRGPQAVQVAATEGNAFSPPAAAPPPEPTRSNAFTVVAGAGQQAQPAPTAYGPPPQPVYLPPPRPALPTPPAYAMARPPYHPPAIDAGTPTGLANAFTPAGNTRPIPADFAPPQFAANSFSDPTQQGAAYPAPDMRPNRPVPPPVPGYFPPMAARGYGSARAPAPAGEAVGTPQLLSTLRSALLPSQREWAAGRLAELDWRTNPQAVEALLTAAHSDPAATVRAGCVHSLAKMKVNTMPAVAAVEGLRRDADPRVRHEVEEALLLLCGGAPRNDAGVKPAGGPGLR